MKLVAAYKAYRGGEWFGASLESIAPFVQGIVVALSQRPWDAALTRLENCSRPLARFCRRHPEISVHVETVDVRRHEEHQTHCLKMVAKYFGETVPVLTPDTDEVWVREDLQKLLAYMKGNPGHVYLCDICDYVRSPYWRVDNGGGASFIAALSSSVPSFPFRTTLRTWGRREDRVSVPGVRFHHFPFVRADETEIAEKMHLCEQQDGAYEPGWLNDVWPNLPHGQNLHPARGCGAAWPRIEVVTRDTLPPALEQVRASRRLLNRYAT